MESKKPANSSFSSADSLFFSGSSFVGFSLSSVSSFLGEGLSSARGAGAWPPQLDCSFLSSEPLLPHEELFWAGADPRPAPLPPARSSSGLPPRLKSKLFYRSSPPFQPPPDDWPRPPPRLMPPPREPPKSLLSRSPYPPRLPPRPPPNELLSRSPYPPRPPLPPLKLLSRSP